MFRLTSTLLAVAIAIPSFAQSRQIRDIDTAVEAVDHAKGAATDIIIDNEEADVITLVGLTNLDYIFADLGDIRAELLDSDVRYPRLQRDFDKLSKDISAAMERFNKNATRFCDEISYADRIGRSLNDISEFSRDAATAVSLSFQASKVISLKDTCAPYEDGR